MCIVILEVGMTSLNCFFLFFKGHDPEKRGMIRIRATKADRVANYVFEMQKGGNARSAQCDVHISCKGGFIPCHKAVLMYFSPLLKGLITDNIREVSRVKKSYFEA